MGEQEEIREAPRTTVEDVTPEDTIFVNQEHAERMDGAFLSIVLSASIPCGLVIIVSAILLGVIYGFEVDRNRGWPQLLLAQDAGGQLGLWATLNDWKKTGGDAAIFVDFNPSSLTAIASLTGKIIPYLSSSIMALVAFFVARRVILISQQGKNHELLSPHQMSILIGLLGGNSYGPLKDCVHYHVKHKKRWLAPIPHAFSALAIVTALALVIPIVDTWFATTVTPGKVTVVKKFDVENATTYGRGTNYTVDPYYSLNADNCNYDQWYSNNRVSGFEFPCNALWWDQNNTATGNDSTLTNTTEWDYSILNINEISETIANQSSKNSIMMWPPQNQTINSHYFLTALNLDTSVDFRASTFAVKTQCKPMTSTCFPQTPSELAEKKLQGLSATYLGDDYAFHCSSGFTGDLRSNGVSVATGLRQSSTTSMGIGFAPDAALSSMIGSSASKLEFGAYTNPLYFGAWSVGFKTLNGALKLSEVTDPWEDDPEIYYDQYNKFAWMLNCSSSVYQVSYDWVNGTIQRFDTTMVSDPLIGGVVSYPFVSGINVAHSCIEWATIKVQNSNGSKGISHDWAEYFSSCAISMLASPLQGIPPVLVQTRDDAYAATRVPIVPLFALLAFKFLYCLAVFILAVAAYKFTNPSETQSVKERLSVKGLAATAFADGPNHQQVAVKNVEQLFQPPAHEASDAEAATPSDQKVGMVMTKAGGWAFVKLAAGKVYDAVSPIFEKELMQEANTGAFGTGGKEVANWVSLVK
ncbi:uncharacterized protein PV06_01505 [Exophiala oligosperma]|uniref:Uncharacterized protein n=2 Tax=Chaetothyriales TaxID=34395 RepID=A0A0D2EM54_9EURO|nr:uncharacterized protein PV06_01505 [Exophiala oligosperma]KAJ9626686.1 hypothetical protein H2204_009956 [Knufia peltigerae]KIW48949.1 hypothetical protein PV06_01505 [Exophiala oligosperma]